VIRFSASLVVVGIGLLVAGSVTSRLPLIYIAIGVSAVALLFLIIGAIVNRAELLGREPESAVDGQTERGQTERDEFAGELDQASEPVTTAVGASAGASAGSGRGYAGERAADPGYGAAPTPPDRPRETSFPDQPVYRDSGDAEPTRGASRYERFAGDGERGRPSEPQPRPQRPFTEPEPTRMDLSAAAVREAGRQQERERSERGQQERSQPQRSRPEQAQPFVDPQPTRMDWAGGLREAERQELARQDQERRARERPERDKRAGDRAGQPFVDPEPTRMDWAADFREHDQRGGTAAPGRPSGDRETAHTGQVAPTRPTPIQQPAPTQPTPARPDKLLVARPDSDRPDSGRPDSKSPLEGREGQERPAGQEQHGEPEPRPQPEQAREPAKPAAAAAAQPSGDLSAKPEVDRSSDNDAGDTERPAEQATTAQSDTDRSAQASATRVEEALVPATAEPSADQATATDDQDSSGSEPAATAAAEPDQDVTVVPGVPRFHRSDCILIRFMGEGDLQRMPVERAKEAGCTPCRACQPEGEEDD
jgi:hypothetical protein